MSENLKLGQVIDGPQNRDAIHIAVAPVTASESLNPGEGIRFISGQSEIVESTSEPIGVVDPFLKGSVYKGQRFWMFLNPGSITSLRHDWTHPAFTEPEPASDNEGQSDSERWIRRYAAGIPLAYEILMQGAADWVEDQKRGGYGEYLCFGGLLDGERVPDEFWDHYVAVTGKEVSEDHRGSFFTCSC